MQGALLAQPPPAPRVVGPKTKTVTRPTNILPQYLSDEAKLTPKEDFDSKKHLNFHPPEMILGMKDIGLEGHGISPNAVAGPFQLFSDSAIAQIRREVFSEEVMRNCQFSSTFNKNMIRGMGHERAPFTYAAWKSPELIAMVSKAAGIDVVPSIDNEIANINISINNGTTPAPDTYKQQDDHGPLADGSSVAWHYDSFPFVCVVMLSDCTDMVGGETALKMPSGEILKVRGPTMGTAVVMQGRYIEHQALKAFGGRERISMVTCFRAKNPNVRDETILTGVRCISYPDELYTQYTEYRLEMLEERIRTKLKEEKGPHRAKQGFDVEGMKKWLIEQRDFLDSMVQEIE